MKRKYIEKEKKKRENEMKWKQIKKEKMSPDVLQNTSLGDNADDE